MLCAAIPFCSSAVQVPVPAQLCKSLFQLSCASPCSRSAGTLCLGGGFCRALAALQAGPLTAHPHGHQQAGLLR